MSFLSEQKEHPPVIFLSGPDIYTRNTLIAQILERYLPGERNKVFGLEEVEASETDPIQLLNDLRMLPMGQSLKVVVIRRFELASTSVQKEDKGRDKPEGEGRKAHESGLDETLLRYFKHPSRKTLLVISSSVGLRKGNHLYQHLPVRAVMVPCASLRLNEAAAFVKRELSSHGKRASRSWIDQFIEIVGLDTQRLTNEMEKVFLLVGDRDTLRQVDFEIVSSTEMPRNVFSLLNAIGKGEREQALEVVRDILNSGEPPLRVLSVLLWHYRLVMKAWDLVRHEDNEALNRIHPSGFVVNKVKRQAKRLSRSEIKRIFASFQEADRLLKGSSLPQRLIMERLVYTLSRLERDTSRVRA